MEDADPIVQSLREQLSEERQKLQEAERVLSALQRDHAFELDSLKSLLEGEAERSRALEASLPSVDLQSQVSGLSHQLCQIKQETMEHVKLKDDKIKQLSADKELLEEELRNLKQSNPMTELTAKLKHTEETLTAEIEALTSELLLAQQAASKAIDRSSQLELSNNRLRSELTLTEERLALCEQSNNGQVPQEDLENNKVALLNNEIQFLKKEIKLLNTSLVETNDSKNLLEAQLNEDATSYAGKIKEIYKEKEALELHVESLTTENSLLYERISSLEETSSEQKERMSKVKDCAPRSRRSNSAFKLPDNFIYELSEKNLQIIFLKSEKEALSKEVADMNSTNLEAKVMKAEISKLQTELTNSQKLWGKERNKLNLCIEETEKLAIQAKIQHAQAATDRDVYYKMYLDLKKRNLNL